jgi:L-lactate dehydrogenase complex protein LldF
MSVPTCAIRPTRSPQRFREQATFALHEPNLQAALSRAADGFIGKRAKAVALVPEFEALREAGAQRKEAILAELDRHLEAFEAEVTRHGGVVHWARDGEEARRTILAICREANARVITKGKSMVSEEIGLNEALHEAGYRVVETDLGEYIIQLAAEAPSHIIAPAVHKTKEQIADLFAAAHGTARQTTVEGLVTEARQQLRQRYFQADVGITGANFLVAETGQTVIVTNEGNGDLTQSLARVHIVTAGIERVVATLEDVALFLRLLARSATGQESETYTTYSVGPRRPGDQDGPEAFHVVLIDNGRSRMLAGPFRAMLRCIRCGACMNHCPVYGAIGGHAYGWVYPGPMGAVLTPLFTGLDNAYDLPNACTLNGRCAEVCPVKIPLPELLRRLRHEQHKAELRPVLEKRLLTLWRWLATRPRLYHLAERLAVRLLSFWARGRRTIAHLPFARNWSAVRDLPAPAGRTFLELWQAKRSPADLPLWTADDGTERN